MYDFETCFFIGFLTLLILGIVYVLVTNLSILAIITFGFLGTGLCCGVGRAIIYLIDKFM